jgi:hypothetical protein
VIGTIQSGNSLTVAPAQKCAESHAMLSVDTHMCQASRQTRYAAQASATIVHCHKTGIGYKQGTLHHTGVHAPVLRKTA